MAKFIPERNDIICLGLDLTKEKAIQKYSSVLVLSSKAHNKQTGLLICSPISTSVRGQATEVSVNNLEQPSVVVSSVIHTLSWKDRDVKKITTAEAGVIDDVLLRIIPLIGAESLFE